MAARRNTPSPDGPTKPQASKAVAREAGPAAWSSIVASERRRSGVRTMRMFGAEGLQIHGRVYATLYKGSLVLKLPKERVENLVRAGLGVPFDPGMGRVMKEWVAVAADDAEGWSRLVDEARVFVAGRP